MACFLVPAGEAVVTTVVGKYLEKHGKGGTEGAKLPMARKVKWLNNMLWGGSALLAYEHVWHGEVTAAFPFLTAMNDPADTAAMLREMSTSGVAMAVVVTAVWGVMVLASNVLEKRLPDSAAN